MKKIFVISTLFIISNLSFASFTNKVCTIYSNSIRKNPHGAWISTHRGSRVTSKSDNKGFWSITLLNGSRIKLGFNKHTPLKLTDIPTGAFLRLKIKSTSPGLLNKKNKISMFWEIPGKTKSQETAVEFTNSSKWQTLLLHLPENKKDTASAINFILSQRGDYQITGIYLVLQSEIMLNPVEKNVLLHNKQLILTGKSTPEVKRIDVVLNNQVLDSAVPGKGVFRIVIDKSKLPLYTYCFLTLKPVSLKGAMKSLTTGKFFVFPILKNTRLPRLTVENGKLYRNGRPFGFVGTNFTSFQLGLSNRPVGYAHIADAIREMKSWNISVVRIPLNVGLLQPAEGVFPDDPRWKQEYLKHRLKPEFFSYLEYFIQLAADNGIYSIIDFHGFPVNPYRYFLGGNPGDKKKNKPGTAIAWLSKDLKKVRKFPDFKNPREVKALCTTFAWLAKHFKGNPNIMGFEVPYNEPHDDYMSVPQNYIRVVEQTINVIHHYDKDRLTFQMPASWGHDNVTWSATWLLPRGLSGGAPHFYFANSPVPLRKDARKFRHPWLCRDIDKTFEYGMRAVLFPFSTQKYPVYNGENGEHGFKSLMPNTPENQAVSYMIDGSLTQAYASGLAGTLQWTLWNHPQGHAKFRAIYTKHYRRFSKVFAAGPVDWSQTEVAFIQNAAAVPIQNGHNFSCVPFARISLDLNLTPVHYITDDFLIYSGLKQHSEGLEQVSSASFSTNYKALIVDKNNLDQRVVRALKKSKTPILWLDSADKLTRTELANFLKKAGVFVNLKTPAEIQIIKGPEHLILYRRSGNDKLPVKVCPRLKRTGRFSLTSESGKEIFKGTADELYQNGIKLRLAKWQSNIFSIK